MIVDRIDHMKIVSTDAKKLADAFTKLTGTKPVFIDDRTEKKGYKNTTFIFPHGLQIQEVTDTSKPEGKWLDDVKKDCVHTLTLACKSIAKSKPEMEALGFKMIAQYTAATEGLKYATFDTYDALGFYIELQQYIDMYDYGYDETINT